MLDTIFTLQKKIILIEPGNKRQFRVADDVHKIRPFIFKTMKAAALNKWNSALR